MKTTKAQAESNRIARAKIAIWRRLENSNSAFSSELAYAADRVCHSIEERDAAINALVLAGEISWRVEYNADKTELVRVWYAPGLEMPKCA